MSSSQLFSNHSAVSGLLEGHLDNLDESLQLVG